MTGIIPDESKVLSKVDNISFTETAILQIAPFNFGICAFGIIVAFLTLMPIQVFSIEIKLLVYFQDLAYCRQFFQEIFSFLTFLKQVKNMHFFTLKPTVQITTSFSSQSAHL